MQVSEKLDDTEVIGYFKPNATLSQVTSNIETPKKGITMLVAGANDVYRNNARSAINELTKLLEGKIQSEKILVVNVPQRYDLDYHSCVNREIRKTNKIMKLLCSRYSHVSIIDIGCLDRDFHTRHGLHLNSKGKSYIVNQVQEQILKQEAIIMGLGNTEILLTRDCGNDLENKQRPIKPALT